jgi:hypothetical protein
MSFHDCTVNGNCTIAVVATGNSAFEFNTFAGTVGVTVAAGCVCYHCTFNKAVTITAATTASVTFNTFNDGTTLVFTAPATANNNTLNGTLSLTVGGIVVTQVAPGGGGNGNHSFW